jgi:SnoaL-like domain
MAMAHARDVVEQFFHAFYTGDTQTARRYLCDDMSCSGPAASFASADDYLRASRHVGAMVRAVETRKVFVDRADVCVFYDLLTNGRNQPTSVAEWYHVQGGKIRRRPRGATPAGPTTSAARVAPRLSTRSPSGTPRPALSDDRP